MSSVKKILIVALMALMLFMTPYPLDSAKTHSLDVWYRGYNVALFNHELPDTMEIDHQLRMPDKMAITECGMQTRVCRINMNPDYEISDKIDRFTLIHEMCHLDLFFKDEYEFNEHGPKWEGCMHDKADKHGFDDLW